MSQFDQAFEQVKQLAEKFHSNTSYYSSPSYQEAEARKDFIDKFFIALGWDVNHDLQHNPYEQEVKVEKGQRQQQATAQKRADYAFYTAPNFKDVKFFVEAKKPAVELKHPDNYFQTIRYGWNANTPLAILTDFEQFHIIDCRYKPDLKNVFTGKHKEYRYTDYLDKEKFAELYWLFSREAVLDNSIKKFADGLPKIKSKKITAGESISAAIDDSFLEYIDKIREELAKAFKKNDESLGSEALTEVTTRTIDRLVFIRFLEDKLIEPDNHVSEWKNWNDFITDCRKLDAKYNGVVFKVHPLLDKKGFAGAEEKMFIDICKDVSNRNSPYDFNYIPVHILGSIYERFLGKVVVATEHRARVEEKPEVRKAGGVYYTPKYIVDYIVKNTVGECIKNKTPKEIATLRFGDIACGSGSFLIGVYDCLLDHHKKYYQEIFKDRSEPLHKNHDEYGNVEYKDKQWVLTLKLKQNILLNNIYGVDIDRQAVEVTQLSLFLKMLEDETLSTTQVRQGAFFSKVLPDLSKNIVCGNSLIGTDIMNGGHSLQTEIMIDYTLTLEEQMKLKPMDFENAFPSIMRNGGFDAIVGNPPYVRQETLGEQKDYYQLKYKVYHGMADLYTYFIEKGISLLNNNGLFGIIVANKWMRANYGEPIRKWLKNQSIYKIIDFGDLPVFQGATTYPCIIIVSPNNPSAHEDLEFDIANLTSLEFENLDEYLVSHISKIKYSSLAEKGWNLVNENINELLRKIKSSGTTLYDYVEGKIFRGLLTGLNEAFIINEERKERLIKEDPRSAGIIKPFLAGKDIKRYQVPPKGSYIILFPKGFTNSKGNKPKNPWLWLQENYSAISKHLESFEEPAKKRYDKGEFWWELRACDYYSEFEKNKIIIPAIVKSASYTFDTQNFFSNDKTSIIPTEDKFLIGLLNSKVCDFYLHSIASTKQGGYFEYKPMYVSKIPIVNADLSFRNQLISLVTQMLEAKKQLANVQTEGEREFLESKCNSLDRQIDSLVYKLYGLTEEEIKIVEGI